MQQFFVEALQAPWLSSDQRQQCKKVLRMRKGDAIRLVNPQGEGVIAVFQDDDLQDLTIQETLQWAPKKRKLRLIASMIRSERMEWMIQKACECGVDEIFLYSAEHGVVRDFGKRGDRKLERLNLIAKEASEQSYRQHAVRVVGPIQLNDVPSYRASVNLIANIGNHPHLIHSLGEDEDICVVVGPEGGFSEHECRVFEDFGFKTVSLGNNVFRAETASIFVCNAVALSEVIE